MTLQEEAKKLIQEQARKIRVKKIAQLNLELKKIEDSIKYYEEKPDEEILSGCGLSF